MGASRRSEAKGRLEQVVHMTKMWIQQQGGIVDGKKRWATEQSPEQGRRKRKIKGEAAKARKVMPNGTKIGATPPPYGTTRRRSQL